MQRRPWAFVEAVSSDLHEVEHHLERYSYDTKTRGHREIQPARLAGEAHYELVLQVERESHWVYRLEYPEEPSEVQKAFHIHKEGQCQQRTQLPLNWPVHSSLLIAHSPLPPLWAATSLSLSLSSGDGEEPGVQHRRVLRALGGLQRRRQSRLPSPTHGKGPTNITHHAYTPHTHTHTQHSQLQLLTPHTGDAHFSRLSSASCPACTISPSTNPLPLPLPPCSSEAR